MTNTTEKRKCRLCGADFKPSREWQKFCCKKHQKEYWRRLQQNTNELNRRIEKIEKLIGIQ